jgi:site-specific DNA-methyltransferase (adenine-specific)
MTTESTKETTIINGDCLEKLRGLPDNSVDAIVTDPPYGLAFMGKKWDYDVPSQEIWVECLRVLKHGGHLLAFAGTRTQHRMAVRIEDAGFEIRDMIAWVYGSGFPKSLDVSKAIDKAAGAEREVIGRNPKWNTAPKAMNVGGGEREAMPAYTAPATEAAKQWQGWGTALKPALEPITVARKPLIGTVAANVLAHGTGALNIDGCRVGTDGGTTKKNQLYGTTESKNALGNGLNGGGPKPIEAGRWPANLIHDGSDEVVGLFPQTGKSTGGGMSRDGSENNVYGKHQGHLPVQDVGYGDSGSAARFFYCAKASRADRNEGIGGSSTPAVGTEATMRERECADWKSRNGNHHPTVKPTDLMRYLCRLVTPPNGVVLDPFMGSGSTGKAAALEGFGFIGIEREAEYVEIAKARIGAAANETHTGDLFA